MTQTNMQCHEFGLDENPEHDRDEYEINPEFRQDDPPTEWPDIQTYFDHIESLPCTKVEKVLLTFPLRPQFVQNTFDYGLGYLYNALRISGYSTHLNLLEWKEEDFISNLKEHNYSVIGIKCYGSATPQTRNTIELIRSVLPEALIIAGGPACYADPENILNIIDADVAFHGECEEALPHFLDLFFRSDPNWKSCQGLIFRDGNSIVVNQIAVVADINRIPYAPLHKANVLPRRVNYYYRHYPNAVILKSRGCPARCRFCANQFSFRERNIHYVLQEIEYLKSKQGVRELVFFDNNFNARKKHTRDLCRQMISNGLAMPYNVVHGMRIATIDEQTVKLMKQSGCYKVSTGIESGDQDMLNYLNKGYLLSHLGEKIGILNKYNIEVQAFVMIGLPFETDEQRRKTFRVTLEHPFDHVTYNIYTPYPGTELHKELVEKGVLKELNYGLNTYSRTKTDNRLAGHSPRFMRFCAIYYFLRFYLRPRPIMRTLSEFARYPDALLSLMYAFYKTYINAD